MKGFVTEGAQTRTDMTYLGWCGALFRVRIRVFRRWDVASDIGTCRCWNGRSVRAAGDVLLVVFNAGAFRSRLTPYSCLHIEPAVTMEDMGDVV